MRTLLLFVVASITISFAAAETAADARPPSLVLITIDTLRADRLGAYGYHRDTTPNLDAFAETAILFERAYSTMATTLPAHASMMTGTHPIGHGVQKNAQTIALASGASPKLTTLAEALSEQGYETAGFVSATPLKRSSGIDRGFQTYSQPNTLQSSAGKTNDGALEWLADRGPTDSPFFLWVHYFDPHWPYRPPPQYARMFQTDEQQIAYLESLSVPRSDTARVQDANNRYDGEVRYVDAAVGRLFEELRGRKLWDETIVVVTADHGEGLGQHGWMYHGRIYNEHLHVPLLIKLSQASTGRRVARLASLVDLAPTLAGSGGLPVPDDVRRQYRGVDLLATDEERAPALAERTHRNGPWKKGIKYALTGLDWKFFHFPNGDDELFDLRADPHETSNVIAEHPELAERLLQSLLVRVRANRGPGALDGQLAPIDASILEELKALGYVQ